VSGLKEKVSIKEKMHITLRGPDGKVKDERKPREPQKRKEVRDETKRK